MIPSRIDAKYDIPQIKDAARGRWLEILAAMGVSLPNNPHQHNPCPGCGGKDRFRFDDRNGNGTFICGRGGDPLSGDGFTLLEHVLGWPFKESLARVAEYLGIEPETRKSPTRPRYQGVDYRSVPAVAHAVLVLDILQGDYLAGRPMAPDAIPRATEARKIIKKFTAQGGQIDG